MNKSNFFLSLENCGFQTKQTNLMDSKGEYKETYFTKGDVQLIVTTKGNEVLWDVIVYSDKNDSGSTIFSNENDVRDWLETQSLQLFPIGFRGTTRFPNFSNK